MTDRNDPVLAEKALVAAEAAASATGEMVPEYQIRAALTAVADDLRAEGAPKALREAADALDREEAEEAAKVLMGNVRCLICKLEWNQRSYFGCHGNYHEFDGADISRAGEVRIEETYAGQFLRTRADALEAGQP